MSQLDLGSRILELRQNKNMTQGELAGRLGVTPQALSKWERNQSVPDVLILADLCRMLGVSADYLLGIESSKITETGDAKMQDEIWTELRNCIEPLELVFGEKLVSVFVDNSFMEQIANERKRLAGEGILMPMVRVRDMLELEPNEFQILAYKKVLYSEKVQIGEENSTTSCSYIIQQLASIVRQEYADILNRDIVKNLTDNLQIRYPALINETIPDRISYGLLTDVLKQLLTKGSSIAYLPVIIDSMDGFLRENTCISAQELACKLEEKIYS